ncbi:DNA-protecting protein DprA [Bifidobacterium sp. CP2]|nr:DNA-protecting protein DprA [Bifidobacterium sp. CP2]
MNAVTHTVANTVTNTDAHPRPDATPHPGPDRNALARAALTFCLDGADALMYAAVKGAGDAATVLELLIASRDGTAGAGTAQNRLEHLFALGLARWGRKVTARGMGVFRDAAGEWRSRLDRLPTLDWETLDGWFTMDGTQWIITPGTPMWPNQLQDLSTRKDWASPLCLWGMGDARALTSCGKPLAVVGSRGATDYGRGVARETAALAAGQGHLVVSGGALGADAAAHWGALSAWEHAGTGGAGRTVAVFAGGLNHVGPPSNHRLFEAIVAHGGALISELCPGTVPEARRFLLRNRIIAALADQVVVTQARLRSGALNTAGWACDLGRGVIAVPGDITMPHNAGCNQLIAEGKATILASTGEIAELMHPGHRPCIPDDHDGNDGQAVVGAIRACARRHAPATADTLLEILNRSPGPLSWTMPRLMGRLGELEMDDAIARRGGAIRLIETTPEQASGTVKQTSRERLAPSMRAGAGPYGETMEAPAEDEHVKGVEGRVPDA